MYGCRDRLPAEAKARSTLVSSINDPSCGLNHLLVLRLLVRERLSRLREFTKLMSNHILRYPHIVVDLPVVHLKCEAYEIR